MKFLDQAKIYLRSGDGGDGCVGFRREKAVEYGGPDGGDGGRGGNVIVEISHGLNTLIDFRYQQHFKAKSGTNGMGSDRTGAAGANLLIKVPAGTQILAEDQETLIADLAEVGSGTVLATGGIGGKGNAHFKSSTNRAPRFAQPGMPGEEFWFWLRLKLIADAGLVGLPNAGKSTFLARVTRAKPKIAGYPFTTLEPNLGVLKTKKEHLILVDIPGVIEGASEGAGLGIQFLKHLDRTRLLLHLVDIAPMDDAVDPADEVLKIAAELENYSPELAQRERWLALNKVDLLDQDEVESRRRELLDRLSWQGPVYTISAATGDGTGKLVYALMDRLEQLREDEGMEQEPDDEPWDPLKA